MPDRAYLDWPFFEAHHRTLAAEVEAWANSYLRDAHSSDIDNECRRLVPALGEAGWLKYASGVSRQACAFDTRAICLLRETLARHSGLADFAFAMQGLGSGAITLFGSVSQKERYLARVAAGSAIAAF